MVDPANNGDGDELDGIVESTIRKMRRDNPNLDRLIRRFEEAHGKNPEANDIMQSVGRLLGGAYLEGYISGAKFSKPYDEIQPGDVVQVHPEKDMGVWACLFATVRERKGWGVKAEIAGPGDREARHKVYSVRIPRERMTYVGRAVFALKGEVADGIEDVEVDRD